MADGGVKEEDEILIGIDQRIANQKDLLQKETKVILLEMIEGNKDVSDVDKRDILKGTAWQKMSTCTRRNQ